MTEPNHDRTPEPDGLTLLPYLNRIQALSAVREIKAYLAQASGAIYDNPSAQATIVAMAASIYPLIEWLEEYIEQLDD